MSRFFMVQCV